MHTGFRSIYVKDSNFLLIAVSAISLASCGGGTGHGQMTKLEYKAVNAHMITVQDAPAVQKVLDQATAEGWEFAGSTSEVMIFKRSITK
jgi:hypothetical protein